MYDGLFHYWIPLHTSAVNVLDLFDHVMDNKFFRVLPKLLVQPTIKHNKQTAKKYRQSKCLFQFQFDTQTLEKRRKKS